MTTTNLRANGEVSPKRRLADTEHSLGSKAAFDSSAAGEWHGVVEDGTVGKWCALSRESPAGAGPAFMAQESASPVREEGGSVAPALPHLGPAWTHAGRGRSE